MELWNYHMKCRCTKVLSQQLNARLLAKESKNKPSVKLKTSGKTETLLFLFFLSKQMGLWFLKLGT
jgi:hypothetical protein